MCRLFGLVSEYPVKIFYSMLSAENAFRKQSYVHSDGWGIGYYDHGRAQVIKEPSAAFGSYSFEEVSKTVQSNKFIVHIRQRTAGNINSKNTHPFLVENWMLAQNGGIGYDWHRRIRNEIGKGKVQGSTSGEHLLFWLFHRAEKRQESYPIQEVKNTLAELMQDPIHIISANLIFTTDDYLFAFRFSPPGRPGRTLFYLERGQPEIVRSNEAGLNPSTPRSSGNHVFIVSSEKLTSTEDWQTVSNGELLVIDKELNLEKICVL